MTIYPKILSVTALSGKQLRVVFTNGDVRIYDCTPLLSEPPFALLADNAFFRAVQPDAHGNGVVWSDEIDLSESELWLHGVPEPEAATQCH
jgi:hypothetical protein